VRSASRTRSFERAGQVRDHADAVDHQRRPEQRDQRLNIQGAALSDPNNWDGPLAERFRSSTWPETKAALDKAKVELEKLRGQLQQISTNIMTAGGGS
jgi:uncharacterized protein YukE